MITFQPGEELLLVRRRHWLPITLELLSFLVAAAIPLVLLISAELLPRDISIAIQNYQPFLFFLYAALLLVLWMGAAIAWTNHVLDVLFVTTERVIDVEQRGLFSRDLAELRVENIEDIRVEVKGFIPSLLNYGNLTIQTAGESAEFAVRDFHDPHGIREAISRVRSNISIPK